MACCTFNYTFVNNCSSCATTFSSLASFYTVCASTKWCSLVSSSFDSLMHTRSIEVPLNFMSWIIICTNYIFTLYAFPFAHSKDDDECGDDLLANGWIFNIPSLSTLLNSSLTSFFLAIILPLFSFVYVHSFALLFPCLFIVVFQLHSYYYEFQNFKNAHNFQQ
jgi:hypothetical protein